MVDTRLRVLIVDDDASLRKLLSQIFIGAGYRVRSADGGVAALAEIRQETPDVLLSDLQMPGMSGFELLSVVRHWFPTVRMIAMSGAYSGEGIPPGVVADAFYEKGRMVDSLMRIMAAIDGRDPLLNSPGRGDSAMTDAGLDRS